MEASLYASVQLRLPLFVLLVSKPIFGSAEEVPRGTSFAFGEGRLHCASLVRRGKIALASLARGRGSWVRGVWVKFVRTRGAGDLHCASLVRERRSCTALRWCGREEVALRFAGAGEKKLRSASLARGKVLTYFKLTKCRGLCFVSILYCEAMFFIVFSIIGACFVASFRSVF